MSVENPGNTDTRREPARSASSSLTMDCFVLLIGLEAAEARAARERGLGYQVAVIDPGVDPADYHGWDIQNRDVLAIPYTEISADYRQRLSQVLTAAGIKSITFLPSPAADLAEAVKKKSPAGRRGSSNISLDGEMQSQEKLHATGVYTNPTIEIQAKEMASDGNPAM